MDDLNTTGVDVVTPEAVTPEAPAESRRESLSRALDEVTTEPPKADATAAERARDQAGRFAAGKAARPVLTAKGPVAPAAPVAEPAWAKPPKSWAKKEYQEAWTKGDANVLRQAAYEREEQMRQGVEQIIPKARLADQMTQALQPFMGDIKADAGGDTVRAITALAKAHNQLRTLRGPEQAQYFSNLASNYGIDMKTLFGIAQASPGVDVGALQAERTTLRAENEALKRQLDEAQDAPLLSEIEKLAKEKPNFEEVRPYMAGVLRAGLAKTYPEAYEVALRLKPDLAPQAAPATAPGNRQQLHQAAQRARSAAVSVKSATPATHTQPKAQDRRSMLAEQLGGIEGRL